MKRLFSLNQSLIVFIVSISPSLSPVLFGWTITWQFYYSNERMFMLLLETYLLISISEDAFSTRFVPLFIREIKSFTELTSGIFVELFGPQFKLNGRKRSS